MTVFIKAIHKMRYHAILAAWGISLASSASLNVHLKLLNQISELNVQARDFAPYAVSENARGSLDLLESTSFLNVFQTGKNPLDRDASANMHNTVVSTIMKITSSQALSQLRDQGVVVRSVFPNNVVTADIPVSQLGKIAESKYLSRIESSRKLSHFDDISNELIEINLEEPGQKAYIGMNNPRTQTGANVIVGIIDSGLDWTHEDFINEDGSSRILYYWDQSDYEDDATPKVLDLLNSYGHEYTRIEFNDALSTFDNTWDRKTNVFVPANSSSYPIKESAQDISGHGTHVAGIAVGNGRGSNQMGVAPEASLIVVKHDFGGNRGTDAALLDGINYVFQRAKELNLPAVINISMGTSYGPHDGTTLFERTIDQFVGKGRIIVAAAGNDAVINWSNMHSGFAIHGSGSMAAGDAITISMPEIIQGEYCDSEKDEIIVNGWYSFKDEMRVRITTPSGQVLPPEGYEAYWSTSGPDAYIPTYEGTIVVGNGGDVLGWDDEIPDHEVYISIQNNFAGMPPAKGEWTIEFIPNSLTSDGKFDVWYLATDSIKYGWRNSREPTPQVSGRPPDNRQTISTPAIATKVIAVGAYTSRKEWNYFDVDREEPSLKTVSYNEYFRLGELAPFSSRGPRRDAVSKPDISAPGVGIASSYSHFLRQLEWGGKDSKYTNQCSSPSFLEQGRVLPSLEAVVLQGTSMASPNVAGSIALMLSQNSAFDELDIIRILKQTALQDFYTNTFENFSQTGDEVESDTDTKVFPSNEDWGLGKIDIAAALNKSVQED